MSINGIGSVGAAQALAAAQAAPPPSPAAAKPTDGGPAAYFDMTGWTGVGETSVTIGPAAAKADLPELSASVLSAVLR